MARLSLPLAGAPEPEIPLYAGDLEADAWDLMRGRLAEEITGGLSYPSKMDCPAWGISATRCRVGSVLAKQPGTVCASCYAMKGTFRAKAVEAKLERAYRGLLDPRGQCIGRSRLVTVRRAGHNCTICVVGPG